MLHSVYVKKLHDPTMDALLKGVWHLLGTFNDRTTCNLAVSYLLYTGTKKKDIKVVEHKEIGF